MCPGTLAEEKKDGREDEEGKDGGGGRGSFGGDGALLFMGVELDGNFLLQFWYLLGAGDWRLWVLCRAWLACGSSWCRRETGLVRGSLRELCWVGGFDRGVDSGSWGLSLQPFAQGAPMLP